MPPRRLTGPLALALAALLALPAVTPAVGAEDREPGTGSLRGRIFATDGKTPATGVTLKAIHLDTNEIFTAPTTGAEGRYAVSGLPYGYYNVVVEAAGALYLSNRIINVPPDKKVDVSFQLTESLPEEREWWEAEPTRRVPGVDRTPDGVARVLESSRAASFWRSGKGLALLVGGGATLVAVLVGGGGGGGGDEDSASPSTP